MHLADIYTPRAYLQIECLGLLREKEFLQVLCVAPVSSFGSFHMLAVFFRVSM